MYKYVTDGEMDMMCVAVTVADHTSICTVYDFTTQPVSVHLCVAVTVADHTSICTVYDFTPQPVSVHLPLTRLLASLFILLEEPVEVSSTFSSFDNQWSVDGCCRRLCVDSPNPCSTIDGGWRNASVICSGKWATRVLEDFCFFMVCLGIHWNRFCTSLCDAGELLVMVMTTGPFVTVVVVHSKSLSINLVMLLVAVVA